MATDGNSCWSKYGRDSLQQCRRGCFVMYDAEFSFKKKLCPVVSLLVLTVSKRKWYIVWWHCSKLYSQCNVKTTRTTSHQMLSSVWTSRFSRDSSDHLRSSWSSSSSAMTLSGELVMAARTDWTVDVTLSLSTATDHWCDSRGALPQPRRKLSLPSTPLSTDFLNSTVFLTLHISANSFMNTLGCKLLYSTVYPCKQYSRLEIFWKSSACYTDCNFF